MGTRISLTDLKASAFVGAPVLKTVTFVRDGEEFETDVYIRRLSYQSAVNDSKAYAANADAFVAGRIAACVLNEDGTPLFDSVDQIMGKGEYVESGALDPDLTYALFNAVDEVNKVGKSNSTPTTNSGASLSSTESVDELSKKPSETSE